VGGGGCGGGGGEGGGGGCGGGGWGGGVVRRGVYVGRRRGGGRLVATEGVNESRGVGKRSLFLSLLSRIVVPESKTIVWNTQGFLGLGGGHIERKKKEDSTCRAKNY